MAADSVVNGREIRSEYENSHHFPGATVIPSATPLGGSMGFHAEDPIPIHVDPGTANEHVRMPARAQKHVEEPAPDPKSVKGDTVDVVPEPEVEAMGVPIDTEDDDRYTTVPGLPANIPSRKPPKPAAKPQDHRPAPEPRCRVVFDLGAYGSIETHYHRVFAKDFFLVMVWDNRYKGGARYAPTAQQGTVLKVTLGAEQREVYVTPLGLQFTLEEEDLDIMIMAIVTSDGDTDE